MNPEQAQNLAELLRGSREQSALSAREVGRRSGVRDTTVMRLEQGVIPNPRPETLKAIADVLGLDLADIFATIGYVQPASLPSFTPYLRSKYGDMPEAAVQDLQKYFARLAKKHGLTPDMLQGPKDGEDEL